MTVFYPTPDHPAHTNTEKMLTQICEENQVKIVDCPQYYHLTSEEKTAYMNDFSDHSLHVRAMPDKLILGKNPLFIDVKSTVRRDTGNIAIELSSFYFTLQRCKNGIASVFAYDLDGQIRFFSPLLNPPSVIFIQSKWTKNTTFRRFADEIQRYYEPNIFYSIPICNLESGGSGDPFVLVKIPSASTSITAFELIRRMKA